MTLRLVRATFLSSLFLQAVAVTESAPASARPTFTLGPTDFLLDGSPFQIVSCESIR